MKMPPKSKIYEAFSAIADGRINVKKNTAIIKSSNKQKEYYVIWNDHQITSNDNATFWQKYPGYPIIAVWLKTKQISYDESVTKFFKNINWQEQNKKNKRNYEASVNEILNRLVEQNIDTEYIEQQVDDIYEQIEAISFEIVRKITKK